MTYTLEIIPRGTHDVVTQVLQHPIDPTRWTETEAAAIVKSMLRALKDHAGESVPRNSSMASELPPPDDTVPQPTLRGVSWIVSTHAGGTVIAIDIPSGQAVAGPFAIDRDRLHGLIAAAISHDAPATTVH